VLDSLSFFLASFSGVKIVYKIQSRA
jgi:hypothetical protein